MNDSKVLVCCVTCKRLLEPAKFARSGNASSKSCNHCRRFVRTHPEYAHTQTKWIYRLVDVKVCSMCDLTKERAEFGAEPRMLTGLTSYCNACTFDDEKRRRRRHGVTQRAPMPARFWQHVNRFGRVVSPELGHCWEWTSYVNPVGYGQCGYHGDLTHRRSWELYHGPIPDGLWVLHLCDNRKCLNPDHLELGTVLENTQHAKLRKRNVRGSAHFCAKLNETQVLAILNRHRAGESCNSLAREFGVKPSTAERIVHRKSWTHVPFDDIDHPCRGSLPRDALGELPGACVGAVPERLIGKCLDHMVAKKRSVAA